LRVRARVSGVVQGVGFRPFVHGLAVELGLTGFVFNDSRGVVVEVEGEAVERFLELHMPITYAAFVASGRVAP